jgi:DNA repair exonuclease SbcCD nuclease subunit
MGQTVGKEPEGMKLLVFSDLHLHLFREFATYENGENSRLVEIANRLLEVLTLAAEEKADCIAFAGDFYDNKSNINIFALTAARRALEEWGENHERHIPLVMCSGTHDIGRTLHSTLISLENAIEDLWIDPKDGPFMTHCVPSAVGTENHWEKIMNTVSKWHPQDLRKSILITHGFVSGPHFSTPGGIAGGLPEELMLTTFKLSIVGHYHNPNRYWYYDKAKKSGILIPGAVIPHNFGNPDPGRAWVVNIDADNGDIRVSEKLWEHPKFITYDFIRQRIFRPGVDRPKFNKEDYYRVFIAPGQELKIPDGVRAIVVQRNEVEVRTRVENLSVGDTPKELVEKYVLYKTEEEGLPSPASVLTLAGKLLVQSKDKELSDKDTEKLEGLFDGAR